MLLFETEYGLNHLGAGGGKLRRGWVRAEPIADPSEFYAPCAGLTPEFSNPREATLGKTGKLAPPRPTTNRRNKREEVTKREERRLGGLFS